MFRRAAVFALLFAVTLVAGCKSTEEKIEEHFQSAEEMHEQGDHERALVELRNVFKLDGQHEQARLLYARIEEQRGNIQQAYGNYLRLVEQYPENLDGRRALARLAVQSNSWDEVERHVEVAMDLAPDDPVVRAIKANLDYRNGIVEEAEEIREAAISEARQLVQAKSETHLSRRLIIDDLIRRQEWTSALEEIDAAIEESPDDQRLYAIRLGVLEQLGRGEEIESQLRDMLETFPDDKNVDQMLIRWYVSNERIDDAEAFLRSRIGDDAADSEPRRTLIQFLMRYRGRDSTLDELDGMITNAERPENAALFRSIRAQLNFDAGNREEAVAELEEILETAEPSDNTRRIKVTLARMRLEMDNSVGARSLVEEVLEEDESQVGALKLKARWLIEDDKTGDALVELRRALDQNPRDPEIATLMAQAHNRAGNRRLVGESLSRAVEVSGSAPAESLRYAGFLIEDGDLLPAEDVLKEALRLDPDNVDLLRILGDVYVRLEDWPRLESVINALNDLNTSRSTAVANDLTARRLSVENRGDELESFLEGLAQSADGGLRAEAAIIRKRLLDGDVDGALERLDTALADSPDNQQLRFIKASILAVIGQPDEAADIFRDLTEEAPKNEGVWMALFRLHEAQGEREKARAVLEEAKKEVPDAPNVLWAEAGILEREGDIDGAISIYERLYDRNSNSLIVANNLASLISSHRDSAEDLERAYTIARRLRGTEVPAFQDTYGWIAARLDNHEEAVEYLEPAARALQNEPVVRFHLAETYAALDRPQDALEEYRAVAQLTENGPRPGYMDRVESQIAALSKTAEETGTKEKDGAATE